MPTAESRRWGPRRPLVDHRQRRRRSRRPPSSQESRSASVRASTHGHSRGGPARHRQRRHKGLEMTNSTGRRVAANLALSIDGRYNGPGGPTDFGAFVPYVTTEFARNHLAPIGRARRRRSSTGSTPRDSWGTGQRSPRTRTLIRMIVDTRSGWPTGKGDLLDHLGGGAMETRPHGERTRCRRNRRAQDH